MLNPLQGALREAAPQRVVVAWSGGADSTALLHACLQLQLGAPLLALHVNHGLLGVADQMAASCKAQAALWGVPFKALRAVGEPQPGESVEAWARDARYAAIAQVLQAGDVVLTAHHQDDQAESVLLALLRGGGLPGLSGLATQRSIGPAMLLRPWKSQSRASIRAYAEQHALPVFDDPSNTDSRFTRNWLRHVAMPVLAERCPDAAAALSRSAAHAAEAQGLLDALGREDLAGIDADAGGICLSALSALSAARQRNALRVWLRQRGLPMPSTAVLEQLLQGVAGAAVDAQPLVRWADVEARRHRDRLYIDRALQDVPIAWRTAWTGAPCDLPAGMGRLMAGQSGLWEVRLPRTGDIVEQVGRPRKAWTRWCQEQGVPVWLRPRTPLVFADSRLCAVGGRVIDSRLAPANLRWETHLPGAERIAS